MGRITECNLKKCFRHHHYDAAIDCRRFNRWHQNRYLRTIMEAPDSAPNPELLLQLVTMEMPYGKYKGTLLCDLPVYYLEWFQRTGFPKGKLGMLLATIYEIRLNGLEKLLTPLRVR